ncbi:MAG: hypothetical protein JRG91_01790 [Deltaproteobacteria bacterium]|nr:hypothetical protein [Deltaproteobacteria bacterium]
MPVPPATWVIAPTLLVLVACGPAAVRVVEPGEGVGPPVVQTAAPEPVVPAAPLQHGRSTVKELFEDLVQGFQHKNRQELASLFPPEAVIVEVLVCPNASFLAEEVQHNIEELDEILLELSNVKLEFVGIAPRKGKTSTFAAGTYVEDGCTAGVDFTIREVVVTVRITEGGVVEEETDGFLVLQVGGGGPWYLVGPD